MHKPKMKVALAATGLVLLLGACTGSTGAGVTLETLAPTTSVADTVAPTTNDTTTTTTTTSTSTTTSTATDAPPPNVGLYGDYELIWAEEDTELADIERAFWRGQDAAMWARVNVDETDLDAAFAGDALIWEIEEIERIRERGFRIEDTGGDEYEITFITKVGENMSQIQVCRLDTNVWYEASGEIAPDSGVHYEVSWLASLSRSPDGEWFVVSGARDFNRPLEEGERPSCFSDSI